MKPIINRWKKSGRSRTEKGALAVRITSMLLVGMLAVLQTARAQEEMLLPAENLPLLSAPLHERTEENREKLRISGEFETQQLLLLGCGELTPSFTQTIVDIAKATQHSIRVVVLFGDDEQRADVDAALRKQLDSLENIELVHVLHDSKWIRDYGPTILNDSDGGSVVVDWRYEEGRPNDDLVPQSLAAMSITPIEYSPLTVEGGNLLSNGQGLFITTRTLLQRNIQRGLIESQVRSELRTRLAARDIVFLEPLLGEETGHVDMFATFTDANTVLVGQYNPQDDPENAAILDRNAKRLSKVTTPHGKLRVLRIPMGMHLDGFWRTYTNSIYANGVLLMPVYRNGDEARRQQALAVYRQALPTWQIVPIDCTDLISEGGALHCASINISALAGPLLGETPPEAPRAVNVPNTQGLFSFRGIDVHGANNDFCSIQPLMRVFGAMYH